MVAHGWTTAKFPPSRTSPPPPHPVSACLHVRCLVVWLFCCSSPFHVTISLSPSSLSFAHGPLRSFHVFSSSLVFHVFTSVVVGFFGGTTPTSGRSLVFFLFLFHRPWPKSSIKYQVSGLLNFPLLLSRGVSPLRPHAARVAPVAKTVILLTAFPANL